MYVRIFTIEFSDLANWNSLNKSLTFPLSKLRKYFTFNSQIYNYICTQKYIMFVCLSTYYHLYK